MGLERSPGGVALALTWPRAAASDAMEKRAKTILEERTEQADDGDGDDDGDDAVFAEELAEEMAALEAAGERLVAFAEAFTNKSP